MFSLVIGRVYKAQKFNAYTERSIGFSRPVKITPQCNRPIVKHVYVLRSLQIGRVEL